MDLDAFTRSIERGEEPEGLATALCALWFDARGDFDHAHELVQDDSSAEASWVHAYLHRKEGDLSNARYWYARAGKPEASGPLDEEWRRVARALL